jgi:hypothetical protein
MKFKTRTTPRLQMNMADVDEWPQGKQLMEDESIGLATAKPFLAPAN